MPSANLRYIFDSGVVIEGLGDEATVLSALDANPPESIPKRFLSGWLAEWLPGERIEARLCLTISGTRWTESDALPPLDLDALLGRPKGEAAARLVESVNSSVYFLQSALTQLRYLVISYAKLTTVVGPKLPFANDSKHLVFRIRAPECYAAFDACLIALRAFCDSVRFTAWQALGRDAGVPRNLRTLARTDVPAALADCLNRFLAGAFLEISEYRDNAVHYAPFAVRDNTLLLYSQNIIHAEIWLPTNPEARTHEKFEYAQKDAYRTARRLVESTIDFAGEFYGRVGAILREKGDFV